MDKNLYEWAAENKPNDEMCWLKDWKEQINFVKNKLGCLFATNSYEYRNLIRVVGTHTSKSIVCPVYYIHLEKHGLSVWMRNNFYSWNVSIDSKNPIDCDFVGVVNDKNHDYCFCEGMEQWKFGKMSESKHKFTVEINDHYNCYVFFRILKNHLKFGIQHES